MKQDRPPRPIQTLAGPVLYKDSGWTAAEWQLITEAMSRCVRVDDDWARGDRRKARKPKVLKGNLRISYVCPACGGPHARKDCPSQRLF